jgi:hypothetical protein
MIRSSAFGVNLTSFSHLDGSRTVIILDSFAVFTRFISMRYETEWDKHFGLRHRVFSMSIYGKAQSVILFSSALMWQLDIGIGEDVDFQIAIICR